MTAVSTVDIIRRALPPVTIDPAGFLAALARQTDALVCIDCEWDPATGVLELVGVGGPLGVAQLEWHAIPEEDRAERAMIRQALAEFVASNTVVYHNADADLRALRRAGFELTVAGHQCLEDTMLADAVLHSEEDHDLAYLRAERGGKFPPCEDLHVSRQKDHGAWLTHNAVSVVDTVYVWLHLRAELDADPRAEYVYRSQSLAILPEIIAGNERGLRVDGALAYQLHDKLTERREQATLLAHAACGYPLNLGSPDQLKHNWYVLEGLPVQYGKAAPGEDAPVTTDKDALAKLRRFCGTEWDPDDEPTLESAAAAIDAGGHPVLEARYLYYGAQQALSHYIAPCLGRERIYPETKIHAQSSGRHSITGPALQQFKGQLEKLPLPDPRWPWTGWDWSNIETWLLGYLAGDELILEAKSAGWDTHVLNFCDLTGTPRPPILTKALHTAPECAAWREALGWQGEDDQRRVFAKRFVYRLHYRGDPAQAGDIPGARALGFDAQRLVEASDRYLAAHPAIPAFWAAIEREVDATGVVYTFAGRPRRLTSKFRRARYREACNHPLQGGVADIYNETIVQINRALPYARLAYGKHDAQWWALPEATYDTDKEVIKAIVTRTFDINGYVASFPASWKERKA